MPFRTARRTIIAALAIVASCGDATTSPATPRDAAGVYVLASVSGRGPAGGTMTLTTDARVERRVSYPGGATPLEYVVSGTYEVDAAGVAFALREMAGATPYVWPVRGEWGETGFAITYPDPADGPNIVETYQRLP